jgi:polysaccharide export outer membrane protein
VGKPAPGTATATPAEDITRLPSPTALAPERPADREAANTYQIGAGDVLQISVWKEPDVSVPNTVVRPDGKITMPLLKEVSVAGLTPAEVEKMITEKLSQLIPEANVTVVISGINSKKIYVIGGVKKEGPIAYTYRMTIMQALSEAGGLSDYAKRKKIYVLRSQNGKQVRLPFNYDAALKGEQMELNIQLLPADTLIVPR